MVYTQNIRLGIILLVLLPGLVIPVSAVGTQTLLTFNSNQHAFPAIDGDWVAWEEFDYSTNTIHVYNIASGIEYVLPHASDFSHSPFIHGDRIVWWEENSTGFNDLYWCDLPPGPAHYVPTPDSFKANPVIDGNKIVWQDNAYGADKVLMYDISNGQIYDLAPDAPADSYQQFPRIFGDLVVWQDARNYVDWDIWMNNTNPASWEQKQLVLDPVNQSFNQEMPVMYGDMIVYQDDRAGVRDVYVYDNAADLELGNISPDDDGLDQLYPDISGDRVVWQDSSGINPGDLRIGLYNLTTATEYPPPVSDATLPEYPIRISGDRIVWSETRAGNQNIYLYTEGVQKDCPIPDFTADPISGSPGLLVNFTDRSTEPADNPITHYFWDFRDGQTSSLQSPSNTFALAGVYPVSLTVSNALCRNATPMEDRYTITVGPPTARFTVNPRTGLIPFTVDVEDTSTGEPDAWNWSFGDGSYADTRTATHTYMTKGIYTIRLNVSNSYGTSTAEATVVVLKGMNETAYTAIDGLSFAEIGGEQQVTLDYAILTAWTFLPNSSVLEFTPPADRGWTNITIYSLDGTGFVQDPASHTVYGNVTGVSLTGREIILDTLSLEIGPESTFYYILNNPRYPVNATLNTKIWEGVAGNDLLYFTDIASHTGYGHLYGTAYTVKITKTNVPANVSALLYMSANASWIEYLADWQTKTAVPRVTDDGKTGEMLPARFIRKDTVKNLDFFEVESPHGLSTFGLVQTTGSGNPFQLITLTVTEHVPPYEPPAPVNPPPDSDSGDTPTGGGAGATVAAAATAPVITATATSTPVPTATADPGASAKIYTNGGGMVTQATQLKSTDGRATVTISEGIVAKDASGNPLSQLTIRALPPGSLPPLPAGSVVTFAGLAYDIGPDGATFSPPVTISFTLPQAQWGQDYSVKLFDQKSGTWQDLPTVFDPATGTVTAQFSHLSILALFSEPRAPSGTPTITPAVTTVPPVTPEVTAQPPSTAVGIFSSMMTWAADLVANNVVLIVVIVIIIGIVLYLVRQPKFPGSGQ